MEDTQVGRQQGHSRTEELHIHVHFHGALNINFTDLDEAPGNVNTLRLDRVLAEIEKLKKQGTINMADIKAQFAAVRTAVSNIASDIVTLKNQINNSESRLTVEDQTSLDQLVTDLQALADSNPDVVIPPPPPLTA